jgi:predicted nucleotidyltransferase
MVESLDIFRFVDEIARQFKPEKVILFGSYAYGTPTEDSDVDLLVIMPHRGQNFRQATRIRIAIDAFFPLDLIVRSPTELHRRLAQQDCFLIEAVAQGITLYDSHDQTMGRKGRRRLRHRLGTTAIAS